MSAKVNLIIDAETGPAKQALEGFVQWFKAGVGMDMARRFTELLTRIPQYVTAAVSRGVQFNAMLEDTQIAMAALLRQLSPEAFGDFGLAMDGARKLIAGLRQEALTTKATFGDLVQATQGLIGPAMAAGIDVGRIPTLASMISRAVSTVMPGAPAFQVTQEGRALLTGQIGPDAQLAKNLGLSGPMIRTAIAQGRLYEMLAEKMGAFNEAAELAMGTMSGLISNLSDAFDDAMASATTDLHDQLKLFVGQIKEVIAGRDFRRAVSEFTESLINLADGLLRLTLGLEPILRWFNRVLGGIPDVVGAAGAAIDRGEGLGAALAAAGRGLADYQMRDFGALLAEAMTPAGLGDATGGATQSAGGTNRIRARGFNYKAPESSGAANSGLWITRAQAVLTSKSIQVQQSMLERLAAIEELLGQRGIKVVALDIPV